MAYIATVVAELPSELSEVLEEYIDETLIDVEVLIENLGDYRVDLEGKFGASGEFADEELGGMLAARSLEMLERVYAEYGVEQHKLAQASVRFLMMGNEDEEEGSPTGFDDSTEVFNCVIRAFGFEDLEIL